MLAASRDKNDLPHALRLNANGYVTKAAESPLLLARTKTQPSLRRSVEKPWQAEFSASKLNSTTVEVDTMIDQFTSKDVLTSAHPSVTSTVLMSCVATPFTIILFADQFGLQSLGFQRDEIIGLSIFELYAPKAAQWPPKTWRALPAPKAKYFVGVFGDRKKWQHLLGPRNRARVRTRYRRHDPRVLRRYRRHL